jgi:hypothetical protein
MRNDNERLLFMQEHALAIKIKLELVKSCIRTMLAVPQLWSLQEMPEAKDVLS